MYFTALVLVAALAPAQAATPLPATAELSNCLVALIEEAQVPAQEAGVLKKILVHEGQAVEADQLLAQIDDAKAQMELLVATAKHKVAQEKAGDDINIRYAQAACETAKAEYAFNSDANKRQPGSVPQVRMNELWLKCKETELSIDKAKLEWRVAGHEADAAKAEADAARENIRRRQIHSPLTGVVVTLQRHEGEWVTPGDPVLRVIRVDRLWVEGYLSASDLSRAEVEGRPVTVAVELARGRRVPLAGKVVFANPITDAGGKFLIRAEVANQNTGGHWLLNPGLNASMSIALK
jgi:multidrug efflux pump subunit AcrA (membrane-fusion protein)